MHAHNPVDWYPWGPEAFAKAKKENKLVFLSVGYSSCYWCHVMERECFENPEVAKLLNQWFVAIKVDREERPDIDTTYMTALQVLRQSGGWPLSMFLTADAKPIVGGTYWPPDDKEIEGQKIRGFKSILKFIHQWYADKPKEVETQATRLAELTAEAVAGQDLGRAVVALDQGLVAGAVAGLQEEYDKEYGGFGSPSRGFKGSKFPVPSYLELLLSEAERTKSAELTGMITRTLDHMAQGGIYDQLGGGFHRYSTERTWTVPHFEKMLYDNAQLVEVYARAFRLTGQASYRRVVAETLEFVKREMTSPEGGFYSALDAETGGEEGRFYVWTDREILDALGNAGDADFVKRVYGADTAANFEGKYHILRLPKSLAATAADMKLPEEQLEVGLAPFREKLLATRERRARPLRDTKILTGWNGQMIAGFAVAGECLKEGKYLDAAVRGANFVLRTLRTRDGRLLHTYGAAPGAAAEARISAYLDDYAYLIHGLLCLHDATGNPKWLNEARALADQMVRCFGDEQRGGFYFTSTEHEKLFARSRDQYDSAQPSGNSVAADDLVRLWAKTGEEPYRRLAETTFQAFAGPLKANPTSLTAMATALDRYLEVKAHPPVAAVPKPPVLEKPVTAAKPGPPVAEKPKPEPAAPSPIVQVQASSPNDGGPKRSDSVVQIKAGAAPPDDTGRQVVTVTLTIEPGWHVYANPVPRDFPGIPVLISANFKTPPEEFKVDYPPGKSVRDEVVGDHAIYEGTTAVKVAVRRAKGETGPLELRIQVQACNKGTCLLPATVKLMVPETKAPEKK
jgi:uncharacterized protein YyaL (SSP411 family)